jgi:hypothetical protein
MLVEGQDTVVEEVARGDRHLRRVDLREGEGARHVDDDLHVDLADALQRTPVKRVLIEQFAGPRSLNVTAAEVGAVALKQLDLRLRQHEGLLPGMALETHQAFVARLDVVAEPDTTDSAGADVHVVEAQLVRHVLRSSGRLVQ